MAGKKKKLLKGKNKRRKTVKSKTKIKPKNGIANMYYGFDQQIDVNNPKNGDLFVDILSGKWSIYRNDMWIDIPYCGPKNYYGHDPVENVSNPCEGDAYYCKGGEMYVYQGDEWIKLTNCELSEEFDSLAIDSLAIDSFENFG